LIYLAAIAGIANMKAPKEKGTNNTGSYRELLKDRRLIYFFFATLLMLTCGYGSMTDAGLAPLLTIFGHQSVKVLGPIWAVNTGIIVIGQLYFIKRIQGRSRSRMLQVVCALWAVSWLVLAVAVGLPGIWPAVLAALAMGIFAVGEMIWSPVGPAILNDMAPEHLRGRYNAVSSLTWVLGGAIGPALAGLMLNQGWVYQWIAIVGVGSCIALLLMLGLRNKLTQAQDGLG
jgi:MFS family permease